MDQTRRPKKWKMAFLTWLCIYPLLNILFIILMPLIGNFHQLVKTLIMTVILVPLMGMMIGFLQRKFHHWLYR